MADVLDETALGAQVPSREQLATQHPLTHRRPSPADTHANGHSGRVLEGCRRNPACRIDLRGMGRFFL